MILRAARRSGQSPSAWMETLEEAGVMDYVVAAYETVPILGDYGAVVSPQQLKCALILKS